LRELAARVETALRHVQSDEEPDDSEALYADDYLVIDADRVEVTCSGERVHLTAIELRLLLFLVRNQGRVLSAQQILANVWGFEEADSTNYVRLYVWRLRQKIEPDPENPRYIKTEHGLGYRFAGIR
jgi:two-component system KDP operon response regulator KdpE